MKIEIFILILSLGQVWTDEPFNEFPIVLDQGNFMIHATLTDLTNGKKFSIDEYIHSGKTIRGKISISSSSLNPVDVHYGSSQNDRLVIQNKECDEFNYKNGWDKMISGVGNPLTNNLLLVGPSLIYRMKHKFFEWTEGANKEIRGVTMKSASTRMSGGRLNIIYYFKDYFSLEEGLTQPFRIEFIGDDPSDFGSTSTRRVIIDFYSMTTTDEDLDQLVNPRPGFGCPFRYTEDKGSFLNLFKIADDSLHYISVEQVDGVKQSTTRNEVYASKPNQISYIKRSDQISEQIYDYDLGIVYIFYGEKGCSVTPMKLDAPGIETRYLSLNIDTLLGISFSYRYSGKTILENRGGLKADNWEAAEYNVTASTGTYDKVISNYFTVTPAYDDVFSSLIPVAKATYAYKLDSTGAYTLVETKKTEFYDFTKEISDEEYEANFRMEDCYPSSIDRKTLRMQFECEGELEKCISAAKKNPYALRNALRTALVGTEMVSASRIGHIEMIINANKIDAYVTFLNYPEITRIFESAYLRLPENVFDGLTSTIATDAKACLKQFVGYRGSRPEAIAFRNSDKRCFGIDKANTLVDDKYHGYQSTVYYFPLDNLARYSLQVPLERLEQEMSQRRPILSIIDNRKSIEFKLFQVDEVKDESKENPLYFVEDTGSKLVADGIVTIEAPDIKNQADCYRTCAHSIDNDCEIFSFCEHADESECVLSSSLYENVSDKRVRAPDCRVYRKNPLNDYLKIQNRAYRQPTTVATDNTPYNCASLCRQSDQCLSFQICDFKCAFGGYYTDSSTQLSRNCDIYIPKVAHKYEITGKKIVTETYHTEMDLSYDQCAAMCYDLGSSQDCVSFNYCPKNQASKSMCELSKYSIKSESTKTITSDSCKNYELKSGSSRGEGKKNQNTNERRSNVSGTSGGMAFGIIVLFIAVGLIIGLTGPFAYSKAASLVSDKVSSGGNSFKWNKHVNDDEEQQTVI